ncbi:MAG: MerR family transcriptional regulator [Solobacterium sp.]|nr:MerR family transcriptional regulator [Solobacterium sp.]
MFRTSELAGLLGVDRSFLHYYDKAGIIIPEKDENNFRMYSENDLIALASSKYYRAMDMDLDSLKGIIHESGYREKMDEMTVIQEKIRNRIGYLQDVLEVTEYAKQSYTFVYETRGPAEIQMAEFHFVPLIHAGNIDRELVKDPDVQKLLQSFPFVSYAVYFPAGALIQEDRYTSVIGLSVISSIARRRSLTIPEKALHRVSGACIAGCVEADIRGGLLYADFEGIRAYAADKGIRLSGEAIAYCVFTNYASDAGRIRFIVQALCG